MVVQPRSRMVWSIVCLLALLGCNLAHAYQEMPLVTGENWTTATPAEKKSFVIGLVTMLSAEQNAQGERPPPATRSLVPVMVKGLSQYSLLQLIDGIDAYYRNNPNRIRRPVFEVIWFELALPNAK